MEMETDRAAGAAPQDDYRSFLRGKHLIDHPTGFECGPLPEKLFPFQRVIVQWACRRGRAAIFADCGLGKTGMQLAWASEVCRVTGGKVLILAPLAVAGQTVREAFKFGIEGCRAVRTMAECDGVRICVTNYEKLAHFDPAQFAGVVLDESSILKAFTGKTKREIVRTFKDTPYRLACTATPAPNDYLELQNHAEFLSAQGHGEMLARYFVADSMEAGNYRLKKHAEEAFWHWVHNWAVSVTKPSDLGFPDEGFELPPITTIRHTITVPPKPKGGMLFAMATLSATTMHDELRETCPERAAKVAELVNGSTEPWIVWCNTNYEADELVARIPDAVEVRGSHAPADKEDRLEAFSTGRSRVIVTKPSIAGYGLNWQHCRNIAFIGLSYSYEDYYQATRRSWRFGQDKEVFCHVVQCESEKAIADAVARKESDHNAMRAAMSAAMRREQQTMSETFELKPVPHTEVARGASWELRLADCVSETKTIADGSVDLSVFSPPFSLLYTYSDSEADMGNCSDDFEFLEHFRFLARDLYRITRPGRLCAMHVKDLPRYRGTHGAAGLFDLPGWVLRTMEEEGWQYHSRVTIWKDPVIEMQRTKNHGLLYKILRQDSCNSRQGMADYVIVCRKWSEETTEGELVPVTHTKDEFPLDVWQRWASPVWSDIKQTNVLQYMDARAEKDERHICPLQLDVIERCVALWSNPGELVFSPFAGIGSEGYQALRMGRRFLGIELKRSYWEQACRNLDRAEREGADRTLFGPMAQQREEARRGL